MFHELMSIEPQIISSLLPSAPPQPPPVGAEKIKDVVDWVKWIGYMVCILGIVIAGSMMAIGQRRGEGGEHAGRVGWVAAGAILIGISTGLVDALV